MLATSQHAICLPDLPESPRGEPQRTKCLESNRDRSGQTCGEARPTPGAAGPGMSSSISAASAVVSISTRRPGRCAGLCRWLTHFEHGMLEKSYFTGNLNKRHCPVSPANLREEKVTNFLLARRVNQMSPMVPAHRTTLTLPIYSVLAVLAVVPPSQQGASGARGEFRVPVHAYGSHTRRARERPNATHRPATLRA